MKNLVQMGKFQTVLALRKEKLECHSLMQGQKNGAFTLLPRARNLLPTCDIFSYPNFLSIKSYKTRRFMALNLPHKGVLITIYLPFYYLQAKNVPTLEQVISDQGTW